jgi:preprotein translocase subunit SecF
MLEILKNPHFDFLGKTRYFVGLSLGLIAAGIAFMLVKGVYLGSDAKGYGVEFSGGTQLIARFQNPPAVDQIRDAVNGVAPGSSIQSYGDPASNQVLIRVGGADDAQLTRQADAVKGALASGYAENPVVESSSEIVGPTVGAELRRKAVQLTVLGLIFQLIYIAFRFKGAIWGAAATIAVLHDVLVTLAFLAFFGYEITLNVIAALLTLVGYSVNDTIVIFDRARELLRTRRKEPLRVILNDALNQTLSRTLISNGTTFLSVLGLFIFGGEVLRGFGFAMVVGILVGTYSTVYIASPIVALWTERFGRGAAARASSSAATARAAL